MRQYGTKTGLQRCLPELMFAIAFFFCVKGTALDQKPFSLRIKIENVSKPAGLILTVRDGNQWVEYRSESKDGAFTIPGSLKEPSFAYLVLKYSNEIDKIPRKGNITELFIDPGEISIQSKDSLRNAIISGGSNQKDLASLNLALQSVNSQQVSRRVAAITNFVKSHPNSFVSLYALQNLSAPGIFMVEPDLVAPLFDRLSAFIRNTVAGKILYQEIRIARNTAIGSAALEFAQEDTLKRLVTLHSLMGNYILLDFWASWCKPCRAQNATLVSVYEKFGKRNFQILGVSLDKARKAWVTAIRKDNLNWINVSDLKFWKNEAALLYGVKTVPQNFLIDPRGKIVARNLSPEALSQRLEKLLDNQ
jgi:peroxiredoxin